MECDAEKTRTQALIRQAEYGDLEVMLDLWGAMMTEHERNDPRIQLSEAAMSSYRSYLGYHINNSSSRLMVGEGPGGTVVGFCLMTITHNLKMFLPERYGYLSDMFVRADWRRRGVGRRLASSALTWLAENDVHSVQLQFYEFNKTGEAFWRSLGFRPYYTRMWLDVDPPASRIW